MKKKRIAVIGGAGFIGKRLCKLLSKNNFVLNIDLKKIYGPNISNIILDILNEKKLLAALKNVDYVFHLGGVSDLNKALNNPKKTAEVNIVGTINVLSACVKNKIKKIIFSSSIYSFTEEGGFYKSSKLSAEFFIYEFYKRYNLKFTILRFGSVYGEGSNHENGIFKIMYHAIKNKNIMFNGSKNTVRRFINIHDVSILTSKSILKKYDNKILMITGINSTKITKVLEKIKNIVGIKRNKITISNKKNIGHYIKEPRKFQFPKMIKFTRKKQINLSVGLNNLYNYILKNF